VVNPLDPHNMVGASMTGSSFLWTAHRPGESGVGMIRKSLPHMVNVVIGFFEEGGYMVVIDGIVDDIALTLRFDEATFP
jgi:hypothetical protein